MTIGYDSYTPYWSDEYAQKKAEQKGCTVEYSDDYTLQLDIDSDDAFEFFKEQLILLCSLRLFVLDGYKSRRSRSGNRHITVCLKDPLSVTTRILLQAVLGSDRKRELLSYAGLLKGQGNPVQFFRPKEEVPCPAAE